MKPEAGIPLGANGATDDPVMERVLAKQSEIDNLKQQLAAYKKDRDDLVSEFMDMRSAREVPRSPITERKASAAKADRVRIVFGDMHGMRMERGAVDALLRDVKTIDPDEIVMMGDMLECGGWLAKHQIVGYVALSDFSYQEDVKAANWFLDALQQVAPHATITALEGNHEQRVERWAVDQSQAHGRDAVMLLELFGPKAVLRLEDRGIEYFERGTIYLSGHPPGWIKRGKMYFTHQLGRGKNAARDAVTRTAGNVTYAHTHRADVMPVRYPGHGMVTAFCPGALCELQPIWGHSEPTEWTWGYDLHILAKNEMFQHIHVPIQDNRSLGGAMVERFKSA
jgi:hypothetical protein